MLTCLETEFALICDGVGDAGSPSDFERVVLRGGSSVVTRPLAVGDGAAIASSFARLGAETRCARFVVLVERLDRHIHTVIRLLRRLGPTTVASSDAGVVELRIDLKSNVPIAPRQRRRAADGAIERRSRRA